MAFRKPSSEPPKKESSAEKRKRALLIDDETEIPLPKLAKSSNASIGKGTTPIVAAPLKKPLGQPKKNKQNTGVPLADVNDSTRFKEDQKQRDSGLYASLTLILIWWFVLRKFLLLNSKI